MLSVIHKFGLRVETPKTDLELPDPKDECFYAAALATQHLGSYLVTGNAKHFPQEPFVVSPREFLNRLDDETP